MVEEYEEPGLLKKESTVSGAGWSDWDQGAEDEGDENYMLDEIEMQLSSNDKGYKSVRSQQVRETVLERIKELEELYEMPLDALIIIARHYAWNQDRMQDWFNQQDQLKFVLGLEFNAALATKHPQINSSLPSQHGGYCQICYSEIDASNSFALACQHTFCNECWTQYLSEKVRSGFHGISAACMQTQCNMMVGHTKFDRFLAQSPKDKEMYWKWLSKSFTDDNRNIKWCPNVQCEFCCERTDLARMLDEVVCECGTAFCFACGEYTHKPCDCATADKWNVKSNAESENVTWIAANTKPCPRCQRNIEKNQGCNHMTCAQCRHEFCWICMGDWKEHGSATGGYYKCNLYEEKKKDQSFSAEESKREKAKNELQRYMWYMERFANHQKSSQLAIKLQPVIKTKIQMLHDIKNYPPQELDFLEKGCETVIQCHEVLKWTYVYGYYYDKGMTEARRNLFTQWQSDLEKYCDHLHGLVEKDLDQYMDPNITDRSPFY